MPQCCRCNASGRCRGCVCAKNKRVCTSCTPGRSGRCENQPDAVSDSTHDSLSATPAATPATTPGTMNDEFQPNQRQESDFRETQSVMADNGPDDHHHNRRTDTDADSGLEYLPLFVPMQSPTFRWGAIEGGAFARAIQNCYEEIVHWKRNLFKVPSGRAGKSFVRELTRMFQAYADASALESVAFQAAMVMPALLLQKPHPKSKAKEHTMHLDRRLKQWMNGDIEGLLGEGRTIQHRLNSHHNQSQRSPEHTARVFAKLMMEGKVRAALRVISEDNSWGVAEPRQLSCT